MIPYDDFTKLDIRLGEIVSAEAVEGADKLLRLMVDFGEGGERQIISGIREYFSDRQELVGKKCPFLVNLEHRIIRGIASEGMLLACRGADGAFALLLPASELPVGTRVV